MTLHRNKVVLKDKEAKADEICGSAIARCKNEAGLWVETKSDWFVDQIDELVFVLRDK